ncbi:hypothetical protein ABLE91_06755 [Aquabacter sp. CN5-332]|uniref:hypothetical protein n=1 Tax=Aquabacter sp. CN5-332 TaxID=3156608 RepID=UPI0032B5615E
MQRLKTRKRVGKTLLIVATVREVVEKSNDFLHLFMVLVCNLQKFSNGMHFCGASVSGIFMVRLASFVTRNPVAATACVVASLGFIAFGVSGLGHTEGFGTARSAAARPVTAPDDLTVRLETLAREAEISPSQMPAWRAFSGAMLNLQQLTDRFDARLAAGEKVEEPQERAIHALMFGAALSEIDQNLSPRQAEIVRRAVDRLMPSVICRGLASG